MRVLFDNGGLGGRNGGVSRYFAELMRRLGSLGWEYVLPFSGSENIYFQSDPFNRPQRKDAYGTFISPREFRGKYRLWQIARRICPKRFPDYHREDNAALCEALDAGAFDVYHLTSPHRYGDAWKRVAGKKPIVVTVHDLVPEIMHQGFSLAYVAAIRRERAEVFSSASRIIAVSRNTKHDLMRLYGIPEEKISVIYHGGPEKIGSWGQRSGSRENTPTVLFVGRKTGYKNFTWFEKAIRPLLKKGWMLVCTDNQLSEEELAAAYQSATTFVYPSQYEGFGLPILEAFANRCPVVCTRASCFPEIAGEAALYFDPNDSAALCQHLVALQSDEQLRAFQIAKGLSRLADFSWEKCAKETVQVYQKALY